MLIQETSISWAQVRHRLVQIILVPVRLVLLVPAPVSFNLVITSTDQIRATSLGRVIMGLSKTSSRQQLLSHPGTRVVRLVINQVSLVIKQISPNTPQISINHFRLVLHSKVRQTCHQIRQTRILCIRMLRLHLIPLSHHKLHYILKTLAHIPVKLAHI